MPRCRINGATIPRFGATLFPNLIGISPSKWKRNRLPRCAREDEKRFAICLSDNGAYIGNIFYTDIRDGEAQLHIFIGEQRLCGKGRAYSAVCQILDYGFNTLKLEAVYALVMKENLAARALGKRAGFKRILEYYSDQAGANVVRFVFTKLMYEQKEHLGMGISDVRSGGGLLPE
jgi:RimJ/RimL family protein N-acetyltransferase